LTVTTKLMQRDSMGERNEHISIGFRNNRSKDRWKDR